MHCEPEDIALSVERIELGPNTLKAKPDSDASYYQVAIYHNTLPESVDVVKNNKRYSTTRHQAICDTLLYDSADGMMHVFSSDSATRQLIASFFASSLLLTHQHQRTETLQLSRGVAYQYEQLANDYSLPLIHPSLLWAKVAMLQYTEFSSGTQYAVDIGANEHLHLEQQAQVRLNIRAWKPCFKLTQAKISLKVRATDCSPERTIEIKFRNAYAVAISSRYPSDHAFCFFLLKRWGLLNITLVNSGLVNGNSIDGKSIDGNSTDGSWADKTLLDSK